MTISQQLALATTPGLKAAATKRMKKAAQAAALQGKDPKMVIAGFKAGAKKWVTGVYQQ